MNIIDCSIEETVGPNESWDALKIDGYESGVKIAVQNLQSNEAEFSFNLIVGYQLPFKFGNSFANIINGMVLSLESPDSNSFGILRLGDPDAKPVYPNFSGEPLNEENVTACFGERFGLQISAKTDSKITDSIYLRVNLQNLLSNCVSFNLSSGDIINYV